MTIHAHTMKPRLHASQAPSLVNLNSSTFTQFRRLPSMAHTGPQKSNLRVQSSEPFVTAAGKDRRTLFLLRKRMASHPKCRSGDRHGSVGVMSAGIKPGSVTTQFPAFGNWRAATAGIGPNCHDYISSLDFAGAFVVPALFNSPSSSRNHAQ